MKILRSFGQGSPEVVIERTRVTTLDALIGAVQNCRAGDGWKSWAEGTRAELRALTRAGQEISWYNDCAVIYRDYAAPQGYLPGYLPGVVVYFTRKR